MNDSLVENIIERTPANCFSLSWVTLLCHFPDAPIRIIKSGVDLMIDGWNALVDSHPENEILLEQKEQLKLFSLRLKSYKVHVERDQFQFFSLNKKHEDRVRRQRNIDQNRHDEGLPVLLPHSYPEMIGIDIQPPWSASGKRVSNEEYEKVYGTPFRWAYNPSGIAKLVSWIDHDREKAGLPILLPTGHRLYSYFGLEWDGKYSVPSEGIEPDNKFAIKGRKYQYVEPDEFTKQYGVLERIDVETGVLQRFECEFLDPFWSVFLYLRRTKNPLLLLANATLKCDLDDSMVTILEGGALPGKIANFIKKAGHFSSQLSKDMKILIQEQMGGWVEKYREQSPLPTVFLPDTLFRMVFFNLFDDEKVTTETSRQAATTGQNGEEVYSPQLMPEGTASWLPGDVDTAISKLEATCSSHGTTTLNAARFILVNDKVYESTTGSQVSDIIRSQYSQPNALDSTIWSKVKRVVEDCEMEFVKRKPSNKKTSFKLVTIHAIWKKAAEKIIQLNSCKTDQ